MSELYRLADFRAHLTEAAAAFSLAEGWFSQSEVEYVKSLLMRLETHCAEIQAAGYSDLGRFMKIPADYIEITDYDLDLFYQLGEDLFRAAERRRNREVDEALKEILEALFQLFLGLWPQWFRAEKVNMSYTHAPAAGPTAAATSEALFVKVLFATDRPLAKQGKHENDVPRIDNALKQPGSTSLKTRFLNGRGDGTLRYGEATVSFPRIRKVGSLERPSIWRMEFSEDPNKHVVFKECRLLDEREWQGVAKEELRARQSNQALVFIHGYNVTFDESIMRAAQIGLDIQFDGLICAFSWGSEGKVFKYMADGDNVRLAAPALSHLLLTLRREVGVQKIHAICHSMGNRALLDALKTCSGNEDEPMFVDEVVMAAPDVDADLFRFAMAELQGCARRFTIYASDNDRPLAVSRLLHNYPRAGDAGDRILVMQEADSIDASAVGKELFGTGHSVFATERTILSDIFYVIRKSLSPRERMGLILRTKNNMDYWLFQP